MPHFDLLILPLIGGFIFVSKFYITKYVTLRSDGYRLIFYASLAGAIFLFISALLVYLLGEVWFFPCLYKHWVEIVPIPHSNEAALALLLGSALWYPLNKLSAYIQCMSEAASIDRAIKNRSDPLEIMLRAALGSRLLLSVTISNRKVYIGYLKSNFNPAYPMESIKLFLCYSGHRDPQTNKLTIDVNYENTHRDFKSKFNFLFMEKVVQYRREDPEALIDDIIRKANSFLEKEKGLLDYELVIPVREIISVNFFDVALYTKFFGSMPANKPGNSNTQI